MNLYGKTTATISSAGQATKVHKRMRQGDKTTPLGRPQWRNEFGIVMSTSESLKGRVSYQNSAKAWEMLVLAWEREIALKCVRLTLNAWDLRLLSLASSQPFFVFCAMSKGSKRSATSLDDGARSVNSRMWSNSNEIQTIPRVLQSSFHVPAEMPDQPLVIRTLRC